jgi:peptide/nickel transport system substrate-binding protein
MTLEVSHIGDTLDPVQGGNGALLTRLGVGETLVRRNSEMDLAGDLADSWKQTGTNEWTFHIKDHVKFQNGDDLTGERVKESLERAVHDNKRDRTLSDIRSVRAEGQDVVIQTGKASGSLPVVLSDPAFVILDVRGNSSDSSAVPVGTGPYEVTQFAKDQGITLKGRFPLPGRTAGTGHTDGESCGG